MEFEGSLSCS